MKRLYLVRHAKSSWKDETLDDIERPLNKRGKRDAPVMGKRFANKGYYPELIVSSPAVRAFTTAKVIARELGYPRASIVREPRIYLAEPDELLDFVRATDDALSSLMLFGHNPGFTELANQLCADFRTDNVPTCGLVCVDFPVLHWATIGRRSGELVEFDYPKNGD